MSLTRIDQTGEPNVIAASDGRLTISVPIQIKRRNGRKVVTLPSGDTTPRPWDGEPTPLQLALARGHQWLAMLESGAVKSLREMARKEGVDSSYVSRMVNLTALAPDIVAAILEETLPLELTLFGLAVDPPALLRSSGGSVSYRVYYYPPGNDRFQEQIKTCSAKASQSAPARAHVPSMPMHQNKSLRPL